MTAVKITMLGKQTGQKKEVDPNRTGRALKNYLWKQTATTWQTFTEEEIVKSIITTHGFQ